VEGSWGGDSRWRDQPNELVPARQLSFDATVPRQLVHRRAVAEVLLTDWRQIGVNAFICAAQWSRSHSFYRVRNGRHDPLLFAETIRQVGLLLCHQTFQIPTTHRFVMRRMIYNADLDGLMAGVTPAEIVLAVGVQEARRSTRLARGVRVNVEFIRDEVVIGQGSGLVFCLEPRLYHRLRSPQCRQVASRESQPVPLPPAEVGLFEPDDVVLGHRFRPGKWPLRVLTEHPVLFDHLLDHVPGMLSLEAMRQAGRAALGWPNAQLTACDITFSRFVDINDTPSIGVTVRQRSAGSASALMTITQASGTTAAQGKVTITNVSHDHPDPGCPVLLDGEMPLSKHRASCSVWRTL
jgi:hypothetical protein